MTHHASGRYPAQDNAVAEVPTINTSKSRYACVIVRSQLPRVAQLQGSPRMINAKSPMMTIEELLRAGEMRLGLQTWLVAAER